MKIETKEKAYTENGQRWLMGTLTFDDDTEAPSMIVPCSLMGFSAHQSELEDYTTVQHLYLRIDKRSDSCLTINGVDIIVDGVRLKVNRNNKGIFTGAIRITYEDFSFNFRRADGGWDRKSLSNSAIDKIKEMFGFGEDRRYITLPEEVLGLLFDKGQVKEMLMTSLDMGLDGFFDKMEKLATLANTLSHRASALRGVNTEPRPFDQIRDLDSLKGHLSMMSEIRNAVKTMYKQEMGA
jgi:hypothetical protein